MSLFADAASRNLERQAPLASRLRPRTLDEVVGQEHLIGPGAPLRKLAETDRVGSAILWGPAGTGKTTLARLLAATTAKHLVTLSATAAGVKDVRDALAEAKQRLGEHGQGTMLFVDEVHRFNKSQQDVLLPAVEDGLVVLIGATTENPFFEVNPPLLSRASLWRLRPLSPDNLRTLIRRGLEVEEAEADDGAIDAVVAACEGDARAALTTVDVAVALARASRPNEPLRLTMVDMANARDGRLFHQGADEHYDQISALIKSVRGSDPDAGLYWMSRMIEGGEDPRFLARRMVILASEDIGLADPQALLVAEAAARVVEYVGLPEAALNLAQAVIYLARAPKSNVVTVALGRAQADVRGGLPQEVPTHLRDAHYKGASQLGHGDGYVYPHDDPSGVVPQQYRPEALEGHVYYEPTPREKRDAVKPRTWGTAVVAGLLSVIPLATMASATTSRTAQSRTTLPGGAPYVPADVTRLGAVPNSQMLHLSVGLAGQNPAGLTAEVAAVSTPSSPDYRHYLSANQFAAAYGPTAAEQQQVASALRAEGLTVGTAPLGSTLLPVSGTAQTVSAAFGTDLESIRLPNTSASHDTTLVNTTAPQIPSSLSGEVTSVIGLNGMDQQHSQLRQAADVPSTPASSTSTPNDDTAHASGPQACTSSSAEATGSSYTSTQLANTFGLSQLFSQGRTGIGQTIAIVEFEQYSATDISTFQACYGLGNSIRSEVVDGPVGGRPAGSGESALDIELAAVNAPSASIIVYEAPNEANDAASIDLLNRIATDDLAQTVTTSWGICERDNAAGDDTQEQAIFARMAVQGQTMIAASGDSGSEDCYDTDGGTELATDDPGTQPDVVSVGGTSLANGNVASQTVWNDCAGQPLGACQNSAGEGAGGGGYSSVFSKPAWQPAPSVRAGSTVCGDDANGCRSVPDFSGSADPDHGVTAYYSGAGGWTIFGGTSAVAPTTAGLFADTDQGCTSALGMVGPALYAAANSSTFTDITSGTNDFTSSYGGAFTAIPGFDAASGLGTPIDQNLAIALQGSDGCPAVAAMSASSGPLSGAPVITISGGGLANASSVNFGAAGTGRIVSATETSLTVVPPATSAPLCVDVTVSNPKGISATSSVDRYAFGGTTNCSGYRFVASDGGIFDFGSAAFEGSTGGLALKAPIVGMATTPSGNGYWLVASDGGIFTFGDARFYGSAGGLALKAPIVGMAATPTGNGYWLVASDGGIFTFGAARFEGSTGGTSLARPIIGMAATPDGGGYWLVASDGGIFTFGDARYFGSTGGTRLNAPIVGMAPTATGNGYWLVASDGGIFTFGDAAFHGSAGALRLNKPIVGIARTTSGQGYWLVASDGGIFSFGDAQFYGSTGAIRLNRPIVGMAAG